MKTESGRQRIERAAQRPLKRPREAPAPDPGAVIPRTPPGQPPCSNADSDEFVNRAFGDDEFGDGDESMRERADELHLLGHVMQNKQTDVDVAEVFSPPRVTKHAHTFDLMPGFALDLTTIDPIDGKPWDFRDPKKRERESETESEAREAYVACWMPSVHGVQHTVQKQHL